MLVASRYGRQHGGLYRSTGLLRYYYCFKIKDRRGEEDDYKSLLVKSEYSILGRDSSVDIATRYGLDGPGIESQWVLEFRTCPDRPWGPTSLLYNGYRVSFLGVKRPGRGADHPLPSSAEVEERV